MIRLLVGAVLAAAVLFVWGFVFWAASGVMYQFMRRLPNEDDVARVLEEKDLESGTYLIPFPDPADLSGADKERQDAFQRRHIKGPLVEVIYRKEGVNPIDPQYMVVGYCHFLAASLLAGVLLVMAQPGLQRYLARVLFVTLAGAFATVAISFAKPIWFHHPWPAVLYESAYQLIGWLLAGMVLGLVIRPAKPAAAPSSPRPAAEAEKGGAPADVEINPPAAPPNP